MGYRDDFYVAENLIGHTGKVEDHPTVYFQKGEEYGHITQQHSDPDNIGWENVWKHAQYSISNRLYKGLFRAVEMEGDQVVHASRNLFVGLSDISQAQKDVLLQSISRFTEKKKFVNPT